MNEGGRNMSQRVKFVSYTGKYPNLCSGVLTLEIDGVVYRFGHDYKVLESWKTDGNHDDFWTSGGNCGFTNRGYIHREKWIIHAEELPEGLQQYADEIDEVFNANVPYGCCGGCL